MKGNLLLRIISLAMLLLVIAAMASVRANGACTVARLAGTWGYTSTGTIVGPAGAAPMALVGMFTLDGVGAVSGTQTSSVGGTVAQETLKGTITTNADCTGSFAVDIYDLSGKLLRSATWNLVNVDNAKEARGIMTSLVLANGTKIAPIVTVTANRM